MRGLQFCAMRKLKLWTKRLVKFACLLAAGFYLAAAGTLLLLRWVNPPTTALQVERRIQALAEGRKYVKRQVVVPLAAVPLHLRHAVIAAEDSRFYQHHGIDWEELRLVLQENAQRGRLGRGASTITQQLVKNLFLTDARSILRKAVEFTLAPLAELILTKNRILELYLNVVEWGPGIYGAQAAAQYHYGVPVTALSREQSARLAAILPSPVRRKPARMNSYSAEILDRMQRMGW